MTESADFKIFGLFFTTFHILIVLSAEPETMHFLSFVTATLKTVEECPCKTVFCRCSNRFHTLIVLSREPETMYLLLLVIAKLST